MEFENNVNKNKASNLIDVTITGDPPPQASSTHEKKANLGSWEVRRVSNDGFKARRSILNQNDSKQTMADSSLGILDNISSCKSLVLGDSGVMEGRKTSDISSKIDTERELARKLLQRCSQSGQSSIFLDRDKENDVNLQNVSRDYTPSTLIDSGQQSFLNRSETFQDEEHPVIFKPTEISARSSALNASLNKSCGSSTSPPRKGGISFDTTAAAELMAQFGDEEFQSGSRVGSRMLADELSWNQNYPYAMPNNVSNTGEKERLDLSCFSGVIGDFDLSLESFAGRKVSVGEFFQRKCGKIGHLQETDSSSRPSFGDSICSPSQRESIEPLVNETAVTEEQSMREESKTTTESANCTKQHSLMSLSTIAQVLQEIENGSPRRLVDQLIQAKRHKKVLPSQLANSTVNSYAGPSDSTFNSLPVNEKPEKDTSARGTISYLSSPRFSLDSKIPADDSHAQLKSARMSLNVALETPARRIASETYTADLLKEHTNAKREANAVDEIKYSNEPRRSKKSSVYQSNITRSLLSSLEDSIVTQDPNLKVLHAKPQADISEREFHRSLESLHVSGASKNVLPNSSTFHKTDSLPLQSPTPHMKSIKHENVTIASLGLKSSFDESLMKGALSELREDIKTNKKEIPPIKSDTKLESSTRVAQLEPHKKNKSNGNIVSARNMTELFSCVVGVSREAEIEVSNDSDRWMTCTLGLHQIQGSKENIVLMLPEDTILVEPDSGRFVKIGVNVRQMGQPIIAVINIGVSDMVTRSSGVIKHVMCFVPEEPQIGVITHSGKDAIDFQTVAEKSSKTFSITLENKNNAELPLKLMIPKHSDGPQLFFINSFADEAAETVNTHNNGITYNLMLRPHQQSTVNIQFNGIPLATFNKRKGLHHAMGKLIIQLNTDNAEGPILKEISLNGSIAVSKIDLVDSPLPLTIPKKEHLPVTLINSGDLGVLLSVSFVERDKSTLTPGDFSLKPNSLFLDAGEKGVVLLSHKSRNNESSDRQVFVKVTAGGNEYYYPTVVDCHHPLDNPPANNVPRCNTPQSRQMGSPSSPHSSASNRSGNSGRHSPASAASTSTVSGDVIPIQSTHAALVWSSVKTGRSDIKEFTILNKSENKIKLQVNIVDKNKSFKFLKDRSAVSSMLLVLQRMGSKEISVLFSPTNPGACAGKIIFTHYNNAKEYDESSQRKTIFLYGYAGFGKVEISQAFKDTGGLMWLSLGHMNTSGKLCAKIKLQNTGDLCSYAVVKLTPKALYPAMISSWHIDPTELLLGPGEIQWVKLEFHPRREDLALLRRADVSHVGTITITHGDEPTRWRIRRLYNKLKDTGKLRGAENETFRNIVFPLCKAFPGEALIQDLSLIKDSVQHLGDLCRGVSQHQVMLTMEVNADETMTMLNDNADDTQMFYSVCSDSSSVFTTGCDSYMPSETITDGNEGELSDNDFTVTPAAVTLAPPYRTEATVTVSSLCSVAQPFETILSHKEGLSVVPTEGMIPAGRSFPLKVQCSRGITKSLTAVLQIFMENHKREVLITVSSKN